MTETEHRTTNLMGRVIDKALHRAELETRQNYTGDKAQLEDVLDVGRQRILFAIGESEYNTTAGQPGNREVVQ